MAKWARGSGNACKLRPAEAVFSGTWICLARKGNGPIMQKVHLVMIMNGGGGDKDVAAAVLIAHNSFL